MNLLEVVKWLYYLVRINSWTASIFWLFMGVCSVICISNGWEDIHDYELKRRYRVQGIFSFVAGIFAMTVSFIFSVMVK